MSLQELIHKVKETKAENDRLYAARNEGILERDEWLSYMADQFAAQELIDYILEHENTIKEVIDVS